MASTASVPHFFIRLWYRCSHDMFWFVLCLGRHQGICGSRSRRLLRIKKRSGHILEVTLIAVAGHHLWNCSTSGTRFQFHEKDIDVIFHLQFTGHCRTDSSFGLRQFFCEYLRSPGKMIFAGSGIQPCQDIPIYISWDSYRWSSWYGWGRGRQRWWGKMA